MSKTLLLTTALLVLVACGGVDKDSREYKHGLQAGQNPGNDCVVTANAYASVSRAAGGDEGYVTEAREAFLTGCEDAQG